MRKLVAIACLSVLAGCGVDHTKAKRILEGQGLSDVVIGGYSWFGCGKEDTYRSSFTAKDAKGHDIRGVVCGGVLKGYTVRFD
ncbi:hypothetical protein FHT87_005204 [Rhizobium sp. BK316]|uniref:hypothetical protein n=1 Tax=Rhizobium sp. BK316 TaxID=2587053 RepID=UPI001610FBDA|nr:hypothetical protein [Rhizobium sp. BK316]MBB3411251.1 hypothetical protein [Rhizobium sp. BK316]